MNHPETTPRESRRGANVRTALMLLGLAVVFFVAVIYAHWARLA